MLVTLTGAFANVGDHLIGTRATALLKQYVDSDVVNINRLQIDDDAYKKMARAKAVVLCGGPAYQKDIYPRIYPLDLARIDAPVIPMGLGWKGQLGADPKSFHFEKRAQNFVREVHRSIVKSSARDYLTQTVLHEIGCYNVLMTGCPAWYHLGSVEKSFRPTNKVNTLVFSAPPRPLKCDAAVLSYLSRKFPKTKKIMTLHHGYFPTLNKGGMKTGMGNVYLAALAKRYGFAVRDVSRFLSRMEIYDSIDLHLGYRVHAHIYSLSKRAPSFLISTDSRGTGQNEALGLSDILYNDPFLIDKLDEVITTNLEDGGERFVRVEKIMREKFHVMREFLATLNI